MSRHCFSLKEAHLATAWLEKHTVLKRPIKCDPLGLWKLHLNGNRHKRSSNPVFSSLCSCSVTDSLSLKCSGEFCHSVDHLTVGVQVGVIYFFNASLATPKVGSIKSWTVLCSKTALLWQRRGSAAQTQETGREELAASASAKWKGSKHLKKVDACTCCIFSFARVRKHISGGRNFKCVCTDSRVSLFPSGDVRSRHGVLRQNIWSSRGPPAHGVSWRTPQWTQHR